MTHRPEDSDFDRFRCTGSTEALARAFDATASELWRVAWYLAGGDRTLAEDALQSTFLSAIEERARWNSSQALRPWLLGILANHVRNQRRKSKRAAGEPAALDAIPVETRPEEQAAELELRAAVTDAIRGQAQPYREVLSLHLEHGLSAQEIASALDRKPGTVRTQIVRGLELLRAALPVGAAVAAFAMPNSALAAEALLRVKQAVLAHGSTVVGTSSTTLSMFSRPKVIAMLTTAATCLLTTVLLWSDDPIAPVQPEIESVTSVEVDMSSDAELSSGERTEIARSTRAELVPQQVPDDTVLLRVRVLSEADGAPFANTAVMFRTDRGQHYTSTDADGRCEHRIVRSTQHYQIGVVGTQATDYGPPPLVGLEKDHEDHEIRVPDGLDLVVKVVDWAGQPVEGAYVEGVLGAQWDRMFNPLGRTGSDGSLRLRDAETAGQLRCFAPGHQMSRLRSIEGKVGETLAVTMKLGRPAVAATGTVVDVEGNPIPGAEVAVIQFGAVRPSTQYLEADAAGRFRIDWLEPGPHFLIAKRVERDGTIRIGSTRFEHHGGGEMSLRLELGPAERIRGLVTDKQGRPIFQAGIGLELIVDGVYRVPFGEFSMRTDRNGKYEIYGLLPGSYRCRAYKERSEIRGETQVAGIADNEWSAELPELRRMSVKLIDERGRPIVGWRVAMQSIDRFPVGSMKVTNDEGLAGMEPYLKWLAPPGKLHGFIVSAPVPEGVKGLRDSSHDYFPTLTAPPIDPASPQPYVIRVPDGVGCDCSIRGRLLGRNGQPVQRAAVRIYGKRARGLTVTRWVDEQSGEFDIRPLSPGEYTLSFDVPSEPKFTRAIRLGSSEQRELLDVQVPETGTVTITRARTDASDRSIVRIESSTGQVVYAKRRDDGSYVADNVHRGKATVAAWGKCSAPTKQMADIRAATALTVLTEAATPIPVRVVLPADQERFQQSWSGTLRVFEPESRELLLSRRIHHNFRGTFQRELAFEVPLAGGDYFIEVESWDDRRATQRVQLPKQSIELRLAER